MKLTPTLARLRLGLLLALCGVAAGSRMLPAERDSARQPVLAAPAAAPLARVAQLPWPIVAFIDRDASLGRDCIFLMDLDGGNRRKVTCDARQPAAPAWSNRGDKLAYYDFSNGEDQAASLWTVDLQSGTRQEIGGAGWLYGFRARAACPQLPRPIWAPYVENQVLVLRGRSQDVPWTLQTLRADGSGATVSPLGVAGNDADGWDWTSAARPVFNAAWGSFALQLSDAALFPMARTGPQLALAGTGELAAFRTGCSPAAALGWTYSNGYAGGEVPETGGARWPAFTLDGELVYETVAGEIWRGALDGGVRQRLGPGRQPHVYRYGIGEPPSPTPTDTDTPEPPRPPLPLRTRRRPPTRLRRRPRKALRPPRPRRRLPPAISPSPSLGASARRIGSSGPRSTRYG